MIQSARSKRIHSPSLIVTADDFGLAEPVNEAVEIAYRQGILTSASLMVTGAAAADAVRRARKLPGLGVGLHLVLLDGRPALPPERIPDLVDGDGRFPLRPVRDGVRLFFQPRVQLQVAAEMRAQLERFRATGLALDHVDGHHHFHQHPTVVGLLASMAREFRIRAVRLPVEPWWSSWRAQHDRLPSRLLAWAFSVPRYTRMRERLARAGVHCNDALYGLHESGRMTAAAFRGFLSRLPPGVTEIYCHPASRRWEGEDAPPEAYRCVEEFEAIADPKLRPWLAERGITLTTFSSLFSD